PLPNKRRDLLCHIAPEHPAPRIKIAIRAQRAGIVRDRMSSRDPPVEMIVVTGNEAHLHRGHVDAVAVVRRVVRDPCAQNRPRLEAKHARSGVTAREVIGDGTAGKATPYDGDYALCITRCHARSQRTYDELCSRAYVPSAR